MYATQCQNNAEVLDSCCVHHDQLHLQQFEQLGSWYNLVHGLAWEEIVFETLPGVQMLKIHVQSERETTEAEFLSHNWQSCFYQHVDETVLHVKPIAHDTIHVQ